MMDTLNRDKLKMLAIPRKSIGISIYMSFNDGAQAPLKNPLKLKELLSLAEKKLIQADLEPSVIKKLLKPGYDLAENETYWRDKFETLAIFIFPKEFYVFKLPFKYENSVIISRYLYLKPILRDFMVNRRLYVLVLEAGGSKFFKFDKYGYQDITPKALEKSSKQYSNYFQIEGEANYHIGREGKARGKQNGKQGLFAHGHDNTAQLDKLRTSEYAKIVAKKVNKIVNDERLPIILAGAKSGFMVPSFRSAFKDTGLILDDYIKVETVPLDMSKLQREVRNIIDKMKKLDEENGVKLLSDFFGTGYEEDNPQKILQRANEGRIDALFVNVNKDVWGTVSAFNNSYNVSITNNLEDEDLTSIAITNTWTSGGKIYFLQSSIVKKKPLMAILRY